MANIKRTTWIVVIAAIATAGIVAAAYASQSGDRQTGFDSDLPTFLKRTDSALLYISRHDDAVPGAMHLDEFALANADPELYKFLSQVDKGNNVGGQKEQQAFIQVFVSPTQSKMIQGEIRPELQALQQDPRYDTYAREIEVGGRHYTVELMEPR